MSIISGSLWANFIYLIKNTEKIGSNIK